jgi:hypothetical protein
MTTDHGHGTHGNENEPSNPSVLYDKSDLGAKGILGFFVVLAVFAIAMNLIVLGLWVGLSKVTASRDPQTSPLAPQTITPRAEILTNTANINVKQFPEPRLQHDDAADMTRFLLKESAALTAEPWQDAQGNVHLPIEEAVKAVATRLPVRAGGSVPPNYPGAGLKYSYPPVAPEPAKTNEMTQSGVDEGSAK